MVDCEFIKRLASVVKLQLSAEEAVEISGELAPLIKMAESLADADSAGAPHDKTPMSASALRVDTPVRTAAKATYLEQSPSEGGDGFTIPRLLE